MPEKPHDIDDGRTNPKSVLTTVQAEPRAAMHEVEIQSNNDAAFKITLPV